MQVTSYNLYLFALKKISTGTRKTTPLAHRRLFHTVQHLCVLLIAPPPRATKGAIAIDPFPSEWRWWKMSWFDCIAEIGVQGQLHRASPWQPWRQETPIQGMLELSQHFSPQYSVPCLQILLRRSSAPAASTQHAQFRTGHGAAAVNLLQTRPANARWLVSSWSWLV